jgi:hypothetical protein
MKEYTDSTWATDPQNKTSTSGHLLLVNQAIVGWRSSCQTSVAKSSVEAEFIAASDAASELLWL